MYSKVVFSDLSGFIKAEVQFGLNPIQPNDYQLDYKTISDRIDRENLATFNEALEIPANSKIYISYCFGNIIKAFFKKKSRFGAMLTRMDIDFYGKPALGDFETNLGVREKIINRKNRTINRYNIKGECFQNKKKLIDIREGRFVQRVMKD